MWDIAGGIILAFVIIFLLWIIISKICYEINLYREEKQAERERWEEIKRQEKRLKEKGEL